MATHWPLAALRIRSPRLELRWPTDDELDQLGSLALQGIHDPSTMPFFIEWTDQAPAAQARGVAQFCWRAKGTWSPDDWSLPLGVFVDSVPIGVQELRAQGFSRLRTVGSGSWLGRRFQGFGYGAEMRRAVLSFAFGSLEAEFAESCAYVDNDSSNAVSVRCGYEPNGIATRLRRGAPTQLQHYRLSRTRWELDPWPVEVSGFDPCRHFFGLDGADTW